MPIASKSTAGWLDVKKKHVRELGLLCWIYVRVTVHSSETLETNTA